MSIIFALSSRVSDRVWLQLILYFCRYWLTQCLYHRCINAPISIFRHPYINHTIVCQQNQLFFHWLVQFPMTHCHLGYVIKHWKWNFLAHLIHFLEIAWEMMSKYYSRHWYILWIFAVRQESTTGGNVDQCLCRYITSLWSNVFKKTERYNNIMFQHSVLSYVEEQLNWVSACPVEDTCIPLFRAQVWTENDIRNGKWLWLNKAEYVKQYDVSILDTSRWTLLQPDHTCLQIVAPYGTRRTSLGYQTYQRWRIIRCAIRLSPT